MHTCANYPYIVWFAALNAVSLTSSKLSSGFSLSRAYSKKIAATMIYGYLGRWKINK